MPIYKAKIFNQSIDLNYNEKDKPKLINLINSLNSHWIKYKHLLGRVSDNKILILLALELQDTIYDLKEIEKKSIDSGRVVNTKNSEINKLSEEVILHKDKISDLESQLNNLNIENGDVIKILDEINYDLQKMSKSIIDSYE